MLVIVFLLSLALISVQAQFFSSSSAAGDESVLKLEANAEKVLDSAEHVAVKAWKWTTKHRQVSSLSLILCIASSSVTITIADTTTITVTLVLLLLLLFLFLL